MGIVMAAPAAGEPRTCPAWCAKHDTEGDVCLGANVSLDFRTDDRGPGLAAWAEASLGYSPEEGTDVSVSFPNSGGVYLTVDDAEKLANMLRDLVATARSGASAIVPGPRASTEGADEPLADWERELLALPLAYEDAVDAWFDDEPEDGAK